jgi:predicted dehydrogenase
MGADIRGAVIGCGFFALNHLNAWRDLGVSLAVCDRDADKARRAAEEFGARAWYTDAGEMFARERLDFADIVTTMPSHRALVGLALQHRVPTIVQKPFAPTWDECVAMVEQARSAGVPLMVHENFRFQTPMLRAADIVRSGEIGEPTWARISFRTSHDVYANQPYLAEEEELILLDLGIHLFDLARVFMGEVETVSCLTQRVNPRVRAEDQATALLRHVSGAASIVDCSFESRQEQEIFPQTLLHVEGRRGSVSIGADFAMTVVSDGVVRKENPAPRPRSWASGPALVVQESVVNACAHWLDCRAQGIEPATSGEDNLKTYALVGAAYESARSGALARPRALMPVETPPAARVMAS